ncbi:manganese-dependent inorganic pyrophosphatase [Candidatus Parcubacteria bacterium]|nr:manganese-dependent inorganic pyrophosphatase [Candidatus Parcubacteria bacterium]
MSIYVIGHKTPDLDSVAAAISYANYKNKLENTDVYIPAVTGEINLATKFVLDKFNIDKPEILESASGQSVILVDHNESTHAVKGIEEAKIIEVLDHHKMDFSYVDPIDILVKAWGSSNTIIYHLYKNHGVEIDEALAGLMLSAILDDTVITKSPTCTPIDKEYIAELAKLAGVEDWQALGIEIFKAKSNIKDSSALEIIKSDYKDYEFKAGKFGIGQVETVDSGEFEGREAELLEEMKKLKESDSYYAVILLITDILKQGSTVLTVSDGPERVEKALEIKFDNNQAYKEGLMSRKKQVVPVFTKEFDN